MAGRPAGPGSRRARRRTGPRWRRHEEVPYLHRVAGGELAQLLGARLAPDEDGGAGRDDAAAGGAGRADHAAVFDQHLVGVGAARRRPVGVRAADGAQPGDAAPVRGERPDGTDGQGVLVEAAERENAPGGGDGTVEGDTVEAGRAVGGDAQHVQGARAGRQGRAEALALRHGGLERVPAGDRRPDRRPGGSDTGVLGLGVVEEVAVDPGHGTRRGGEPGHGGPCGHLSRVQQPDAHLAVAQVDAQHMGVRHALGRPDVEVGVLDARRDGDGPGRATGRCGAHEGRAGQHSPCRQNRQYRS